MNNEIDVSGSGVMQRHDGSFFQYGSRGEEVDCKPVYVYEEGKSWQTPHGGFTRTELIRVDTITGERKRIIP